MISRCLPVLGWQFAREFYKKKSDVLAGLLHVFEVTYLQWNWKRLTSRDFATSPMTSLTTLSFRTKSEPTRHAWWHNVWMALRGHMLTAKACFRGTLVWLSLNIDRDTCTETTQDWEPMDRAVSLAETKMYCQSNSCRRNKPEDVELGALQPCIPSCRYLP